MFHDFGLVIVRRARLVLALSLVVLGVSVVLGIGAFAQLQSEGFDDPASDSSQAALLLNQKFGGEPNLVVLVHAKAGSVDDAAAAATGTALTERLATDERLRGVTSYWATKAAGLRSRDGSDALILARVVGGDDNKTAVTNAYGKLDEPAITVKIGGSAGTDIGGQVGKDLGVAEAIAVPITLILLILAFGSLVSALLPLSVSVVAIFGTFAELFLLTKVTDVSIFAINLTTALGLGLGIDYALLMVNRFREQLAAGDEVGEAVARTVATAGRTIAFSALTVATALAAMLVFPVYFLKSFAYAGVGVTVLSALAALTVLPAALAVLGHHVNAGRVPAIKAVHSAEAPFWARLARAVMRRPVVAAAPVVIVLLLLATPLLGVRFGSPDERVLPAANASHQVGDTLRQSFATAPSVVDVVLRPNASPAALRGYAQALSGLADVAQVNSSAGSFSRGQSAKDATDARALRNAGVDRVSITITVDSQSDAAQRLVARVRDTPSPPGSAVQVGGSSAVLVDAKHAIASRLLLAGIIIVLTTFVLLFLFTGSVVQPIRALVGNVLTLGATLGVMVWIFQDGHLSGLLGFTPTPTDTAMPVLLFCIAFGLSMDYEVFLISRIKELHDAGSSNEDAVVHGLARTGRIVSTAAALLAVSFFAFATSHVSFIQFFGLGTGLAILIDATLIRGVLVPAFMRVVGEASWYAPTSLARLHERIGQPVVIKH